MVVAAAFHRAIIRVLSNTGARLSEVANLNLEQRGYRGSVRTLYRYLQPLRTLDPSQAAPPVKPGPPKIRHVTTWLLRRPEDLDRAEQATLTDILGGCTHLDRLSGHFTAFAKAVAGCARRCPPGAGAEPGHAGVGLRCGLAPRGVVLAAYRRPGSRAPKPAGASGDDEEPAGASDAVLGGHFCCPVAASYAKIAPTTLAKAYDDAGNFARNVRTIEVLVDRKAVTSGAAAIGQPWQYYDLGHGYCTYTFVEQCPHRMACARCDFYTPKESSKAQLLEVRGNLQQMLASIPLTDDEKAAVDDGKTALDRLLQRLADVPTPAGPTPQQIGIPVTATLLPIIDVGKRSAQNGASDAAS